MYFEQNKFKVHFVQGSPGALPVVIHYMNFAFRKRAHTPRALFSLLQPPGWNNNV